MDDTISRKAAIEVLDKYAATLNPEEDNKELWRVDSIKSFIKQFPSAQPQRMKGKWEDAHRYGWNGTFWFIKCSNCGYERKDDTHVLDEEYRFCPYCGAEMEGEQDDNS